MTSQDKGLADYSSAAVNLPSVEQETECIGYASAIVAEERKFSVQPCYQDSLNHAAVFAERNPRRTPVK